MGYLQDIKSWTFEVESFSSRLSHVNQLGRNSWVDPNKI